MGEDLTVTYRCLTDTESLCSCGTFKRDLYARHVPDDGPAYIKMVTVCPHCDLIDRVNP